MCRLSHNKPKHGMLHPHRTGCVLVEVLRRARDVAQLPMDFFATLPNSPGQNFSFHEVLPHPVHGREHTKAKASYLQIT